MLFQDLFADRGLVDGFAHATDLPETQAKSLRITIIREIYAPTPQHTTSQIIGYFRLAEIHVFFLHAQKHAYLLVHDAVRNDGERLCYIVKSKLHVD